MCLFSGIIMPSQSSLLSPHAFSMVASSRRSSPSNSLSPSSSYSSPFKKARVEYVWHRLLDINAPSEPIRTQEWIPKSRLQRIVGLHMDTLAMDEKEQKVFTRWAEVIVGSSLDAMTVDYVKPDRTGIISKMEAGVYVGSAFVGRSFAIKPFGKKDSYRVQKLPRIIRNTLYRNIFYDIDIKNSHPCILSQLFADLPIPYFKEYACSRDQMVKDVIEFSHHYDDEHGGDGSSVLDAMVVKKIVGSIINNCDPCKLGLFGAYYRYLSVARQVPLFKHLLAEREAIYAELRQRYAGFVSMVDAYKGSSNIACSMSVLLQDVEDEVVRVAFESLMELGGVRKSPYVIFLFDGFLYPMDCIDDIAAALTYMSERVYDQLELKVEFAIKPMVPFLDGCETDEKPPAPVDSVPCGEPYEQWKERFEQMHYRLENPCVYVRRGKSGPQYFNQTKFVNEVCAMEEKGHVKEWIADPHKRMYETEVFLPPPRISESWQYNTFEGLRAESLPEVPEEDVHELIKPILRHVQILGGDDERCTEYLLKWMATRVQKPGFLPKVVIGIRSVEGTGKDSFFNFIGVKILGKDYFTQAPDLSSFFSDKHSMALKDKLLVVVSECSRGDANSLKNRFKSFITAEKVKFRPLYVEEMTRDNFAGFVMFSQDNSFIALDGDDRRFATMDASAYLANNPDYFNRLHECFDDDRVARAFYQHLMSIDLSGFEISRDRPMTNLRASLINSSVRASSEFMINWLERTWAELNDRTVLERQVAYVKRVDLWLEFKQFVESEMPAFKDTYRLKQKFYADLSQLIADTKTPESHAVQMVKINGVIKYKIHLKNTLAYLNKMTSSFDLQVALDEEEGS